MTWFADNPEWLCTVVVIASCIAINATLPVWLRLAKIYDDRKNPKKERALKDSGVESDNETDGDGSQNSIVASTIGSQLDAVLEARPRKTGRADRSKHRKRERDIRYAAGITKIEVSLPTTGSLSGAKSVMSKLSFDDVASIKDADNEKEGGETKFHGTEASYKRRSCWQVVMEVTEWDSSLANLAGFYMVQGLAEKVFAIVELAVISHMIGTTEANAYLMVQYFFELSGVLVIGFEEAIGILVPQADGSGNDLLVGRYLQIGIIFTIIFHIPGFLIWSFYAHDVIVWFGFDETTATIAQNYTYSMFLSILADAVDGCLITFFDVTDHELYVTVYSVIGECTSAGVLVAMASSGVSNMVAIGLAQSLVSLTLLFVNVTIVVNNGWLDDYSEGIVKSFGLKDRRAMRTTFVTAVPLAIAWLLSIGEWQLMLIFAQSLGPDEVAAWNMLGYIWELFGPLTEAISAAAEVRVGFRMGAGKPQEARKMSEKSVYLGTQFAIITAGGLFVIAEYLLPWITPNLIYQKLIFDQIPMIGFGGILMVPGLVIQGIFCAQGRVRLMTIIEIVVSWFIAIPIAAILVYSFNFSIDGIVAGLVIGYSTGASVLLFFFLRSNWEQLSAMVMKQNATEGLQYLDAEWDELPQEVQNAASTLGYTEIMWESNREPDTNDKSWNDLTAAERTAAGVLGYNTKKWNGERESTEYGANYEEFDFDDLPKDVKEAAKFLGFTRSIWDKDGKIPLERKDWADLTAEQQKAAGTLGYTKRKWDDESDSDTSLSSSSSDKAMPATPEEKEEATHAISKQKEVDYGDCDFIQLPPEVKKAAKFLGYTRSIWDHDGKIPIENEEWEDLTAAEQNAARTLGYNRQKWDDGSDSGSSSPDNLEPHQKTEKVVVNIENNSCGFLDRIVDPFASMNASFWGFSTDSAELLHKPLLSKSKITESDITTSLYRMTGNGKEKRKNSKHSITKYDEHRFDELSNDIQQAARTIGFTRTTWDRNLYVPRKNQTWDSLTLDEMDAALSLGCTEEKWEKLLDSW